MQKYEILGVIGEGAYGVVLRCRHIDTKELVAIKKFKESEEDQHVKKTTVREVKVLRALDHNNIVRLKEAFRKKGIVYLAFEYVNNNLLEVLEKQPSGIHIDTIRQIIYQVVKGIAYLHQLNIVHRDIKPENVLVGDRMVVKICDFGFARVVRPDHGVMTDYVATRWYRAPQLLVGAGYQKQVDMWAVGCILGQLVDGMPMFPGQNQLDQLFLIQKCLGSLTTNHNQVFIKNKRFHGMKFPEINSLETVQKRYFGKLPPKGLNFLKSLLRMDPDERLTAIDALKHPFFDGLREDDYIKRLQSTNSNHHRITSACETTYDKRSSAVIQLDDGQKGNAYQGTTRGKFQIKRKEENSQSSNFKMSVQPQQHSKSTNKGTHTKKVKDTTLSLQKHHNRDIIAKTQAGFFISSKEEDTMNCGRNKIYGASKLSPKSREGPRRNKLEQAHSTSDCLQPASHPLLMLGNNQLKKTQIHRQEKVTSMNMDLSHNQLANDPIKQV